MAGSVLPPLTALVIKAYWSADYQRRVQRTTKLEAPHGNWSEDEGLILSISQSLGALQLIVPEAKGIPSPLQG
jgi:hypothetical protein